MTKTSDRPDHILVRGARVHTLKNLDVSIPLNEIVGIAGVSGSGKSSLAMGVLYAEGSRRYLEALSAYTRRRLTRASRAAVDEVLYIPSALALHQRPAVPGIRSTFGTMSELLNALRLMFSRLSSHVCPNGHHVPPTLAVAAEQEITCPECGARFYGPSAEELSFNSQGACPRCQGTGFVRAVDESTLVPDESLSIDDGAVLPWKTLMWSLMTDVCRAMGVRTDVPFRELTEKEREIVFHGPAVKKHIFYKAKNTETAGELDFTYYNAVYTVENALSKVKDEKGMKRVERFLKITPCPDCQGTRLSEKARAPLLAGMNLAKACTLSLTELIAWVKGVPGTLPEPMRPMAQSICDSFQMTAARLLDLGLGYLSLDRAGATLSTGERQRVQLARAVRNRTTGVLYVLDEPSIGLHPRNLEGLTGVMDDLKADGNSVIVVDHDTQVLRRCDHLLELGPGAGANGGRIIAQGTVAEVKASPHSVIAPYLGNKQAPARAQALKAHMFDAGAIAIETTPLHTVHALKVRFPQNRLCVITGVSGSGKTTLILESLMPALLSKLSNTPLPAHVKALDAPGLTAAKLIDASPIGINVRSTVATYCGVHDELRKAWAASPDAKARRRRAGDFSYNTGALRCPECDGTGEVSLDVQFLPDVDIPCPSCRGSRYGKEASEIRRICADGKARSLPEVMAMEAQAALPALSDLPSVKNRLQILADLGVGYLTLGEATPGLSGGEAQRLKLCSEMGRSQKGAVFVFDEPTIGLHPQDVKKLIGIFDALVSKGATVIVIEHDQDVIRSADWIVDMGPGGGGEGGRVVCEGTPDDIRACPESVTGRYL